MPVPFRVLIVEDDVDACQNMVDILSLDNYQIATASHCRQAIGMLESEQFGAVVVDWKLPDGNVADLFPVILKHQPNAPIIVVTGLRDFDVAVTALRKGVYDFLLKPINADALRAVLARVVERRRNLDDLEAAQKKLVQNERLAAIGQMMAGLAHESRNAFQRSHACLTNLAYDVRDMPESLELVRKVQSALDHLNGLLDEVRDYAAPIVLEKSATGIEHLVQETWQQIVTAHPHAQRIRLNTVVAPDFPSKLKVDRVRLGQVFWNLLDNARSACAAEQGEIMVELKLRENPVYPFAIRISDNGEGIPADVAQQIFEPFFTTKTKGTGLGLAICNRLVNAHDGELTLDTQVRQGTSFWLALPRAAECESCR